MQNEQDCSADSDAGAVLAFCAGGCTEKTMQNLNKHTTWITHHLHEFIAG